MRKPMIVLFLGLAAGGCGVAVRPEDILSDDFSVEVPGRWTTTMGAAWQVRDGELVTEPKTGKYQKAMAVVDLPMKEGVVEVVIRSKHERSASVGIVGKFISGKKCLYMRIAYWKAMVSDHCPGDEIANIGPFSLYNPEHKGAEGTPVHLKMVIRDGKIGVYIEGLLRCVLKDPYPDQAGRPGVYSESSSYVSSFTARRTK